MSVILLEQHKRLFRSDAAFDEFVAVLESADASYEAVQVWGKNRVVCNLAPATALAPMEDRMDRHIARDPNFLDELKDRLENDDIVDWPTP